MTKLKYIIDPSDKFMIFPLTVQHDHAARLMEGNFGPDVVGAGFINFIDGEVFCHGESISLDLKSRGNIDSKIIADSLDLKH